MTLRVVCIVSWNIRKAVGLDWRRDPARVMRVIEAMEPDIVLLQEADKRLRQPPPALPIGMVARAGFISLDADSRTPSIGHHGNAILLKTGLSATQIKPIDLPGLEPRGGFLARIEGAFGALTVGSLHLGLRHADRRRQVAHAIEVASRMGGPFVLGGDLNEWRAGRTALGLPDGWIMLAPGATFHAAHPTLRLDRFIVSGKIDLPEDDILPRRESLRASDHLPIRLRFDLAV